ncbi:MAG: hypothetical protein ACLQVL_15995 [Terriglobia bacterium]
MKPATILTLLTVLTLPLIADNPKGTVPRSAAEKYAAHAAANGAAIGATLLTPKEVHKAFTSDLSRCCRVVEVALYPAKDNTIDVSTDEFVLRFAGTETATKASSAAVLAAQSQKKDTDGSRVSTVGEVHVGYESGIDPLTGQRVHGVETGGGVGVGVGNMDPRPSSTDRDRELMEMEMAEKALPEGTALAPVAGYLYFALSKDNKKALHELEYTLNGQKVSLKLD